AIVMNPNNGEVLAMASLPDFNLNDPMNLSEFYEKEEINNMSSEEKKDFLNGVWRNFAISDTYEPGSTFKPITIAAAIEEGILNRDETFLCEGYKVVHDTRINCWEKEGHGEQSITEALSNSCNIALMEIGELIGKELFIKYQKDFGFGQKTQIDLPGEASGENLLYNVNAMGPVELATNSFGQTFNVTPLQLITSISSLINGGELLEPHLVKQIVDEDGRNIKSIDKKVVKKVVSKQTADIVKNYMFEAVLEGTGQKAQISGYEIGGKTGTAEKGFPRGKDKYIVSFVGFTPIENPEVIVLVVVDEPQVKDYDSRYASEIFKEIMTNILPYLNIY
ncbi:MAG: peptidoglycan D,D-transpeptidase FtsI family protein, partial [Eubacteriales bacterium]